MLKLLALVHIYYKGIRTMLISLAAVSFLVMMMLSLTQGYYNFEMKDIELVEKSEIADSDYFMQYTIDMLALDVSPLIKEISTFEGVKDVVYSYTEEQDGMGFHAAGTGIGLDALINIDTFTGSYQPPSYQFSPENILCPTFYVVYSADSSDAEKAEVREFMLDNGDYISIKTITEDKKNILIKDIQKNMLVPQIMAGLVIFSCIVITILTTSTKLADFAVYNLCGAAKTYMLFIGLLSFSLILAIPCTGMCIFICNFSQVMEFLRIDMSIQPVLVGGKECVTCIIMTLAIIIASGITQTIMMIGKTPTELYRRYER